jgi:uncharacterized protein (TIGR02444 family)
MNSQEPTEAGFIQFCAALFDRPGVAGMCLDLQDRLGWNVNCLLLSAWAAHLGYELADEFWVEARAAIRTLDEEAVKPVRQIRRKISRNPKFSEELKGGMKRLLWYAELRAEQAVEAALHRTMIVRAKRGDADLQANLTAYAGEDSAELRQLAKLLSESMAS